MEGKSMIGSHARRGSRLGGPPSVQGLPPTGPNATGKSRALGHPGLLQTITKLEQDSENKAYELIHLRTLVLKVEREREDAMAQVKRLTSVNQELQEELARQNEEIAQLHKERVDSRVGEWLMGASGLSHVRAAGHATSKTPESVSVTQASPSKACWSRDGAASMISGHPPTARQHLSNSNESDLAPTPGAQYEAEIKALKETVQELQDKLSQAMLASEEAAGVYASSQRHPTARRKASSSFREGSADGLHGSAGAHAQAGMAGSSEKRAAEGGPELARQLSTKSRAVQENVPELQDAIAKLNADREEQAALRQVEVQHLKYTHQQELQDKDKQIASLKERLHESARRIEQLESILGSEPVLPTDRLGSESSLAIGLASIRSAAFPFVQDLVPGDGQGVASKAAPGGQLGQLQELVQVLRAQLTDKQAQSTAATRTTADLAAQLAGAQAQLADAQMQAQNATRSAADLAAQLAAQNGNRQERDSEVEQQLRDELSKAQLDLEQLQELHSSVQSSLQASQAHEEALSHELTQLKESLTQTKADLAACRADLISAQSALLVVTEHANASSQQLSDVQQQLADSQAQMILTQQHLSDKQAQLADVQGQLASSKHAAEAAQQQHTQQQALLIQSQQQVTDLQGQLNHLQTQLTELNCKLPEVQQQLADAQKQARSSEQRADDQQQQVAALQASLAAVQAQLLQEVNSSKTVVVERASAEAAIAAAGKETAQLLRKVSDQEEQLRAKAQEVHDLLDQRQALQTQVAVVESRLADLQRASDEREALFSGLQRQVAERDVESSQLKRQMTEKDNCLLDLTTRESIKDTGLSTLQQQLQDKDAELVAATQQLEQLQQQMDAVSLEAAEQYAVYCEVAGLGQATAARCRQLFLELAQAKSALQAAQDLILNPSQCPEFTLQPDASQTQGVPAAPPVPEPQAPKDTSSQDGQQQSAQVATVEAARQQLESQLQVKTKELAAALRAQHQLEGKLHDSNAQLHQAVEQVNQLRAAEAVRQASLAKAQAAVMKQDRLTDMQASELRSKSAKMQQLIRDMGAQMASLQVQLKQQITLSERLSAEMLALQGDVAASRREAKAAQQDAHKAQAQVVQEQDTVKVVKAQLAGAEADTRRWRDAHDHVQREVAVVRRRLWDTERKLAAGLGRRQSHSAAADLDQTDKFDSSLLDAHRQQRAPASSQQCSPMAAPAAPQPAGGDVTAGISRAEGLNLYRRLRSIASMYQLQLGTSLSAKQRSPSSAGNATPHQLWSTVHAVVAALEAGGGITSAASPRSRSPTNTSGRHAGMWAAPVPAPQVHSPTSRHLVSGMTARPARPVSAPVQHLVGNKGLVSRPRQASHMTASCDPAAGAGGVKVKSDVPLGSGTKLPGLGGWVS